MPTEDDEVAVECFSGPGKQGEKICANCETPLDPTQRHPATAVDDDGAVVYLFCSESCREAWRSGGSGE